jgi:hypothetical protein
MGLLDDAIKQHLELKRQHGAPEEEIERQEEEALGPARRDIAPAEPAGGDGDVELETPDEAPAAEAASEQETELFEPEEREPALDQPEAAEDELDAPVGAFDEPDSEADARPDTPFEPSAGPDEPLEPDDERERESGVATEPEGVPEPDALPPSPAPFDANTAFEEFGRQDETEAEPEGEGEDEDEDKPEGDSADVLEDTPDFLQETPEHDRLWFEQKPPRDFDFD